MTNRCGGALCSHPVSKRMVCHVIATTYDLDYQSCGTQEPTCNYHYETDVKILSRWQLILRVNLMWHEHTLTSKMESFTAASGKQP